MGIVTRHTTHVQLNVQSTNFLFLATFFSLTSFVLLVNGHNVKGVKNRYQRY